MKLNFQKTVDVTAQSTIKNAVKNSTYEEQFYDDEYYYDDDINLINTKKVKGFFSLFKNKEVAYLLTILITLVPFVIMQNMAQYTLSIVWFIIVQLICFAVCKFTE